MKGIAFHWDPPCRDIYSGMDKFADAWRIMCAAFGLQHAVIAPEFPWNKQSDEVFPSLEDFMAQREAVGESVVFAELGGTGLTVLSEYDWLVFGPTNGWQRELPGDIWTYSPSPPGGFHALHLAHIAAHIGTS